MNGLDFGRIAAAKLNCHPTMKTNISGPAPILPLPILDARPSALESPHVVRVLDRIRFKVVEDDPDGEMHEFAWFAREYPRAYRHHLECAEFRISTISKLYAELHRELVPRFDADESLEVAQSDIRVKRIYWDFESYLCEIGAALDLLARIVGLAYKHEMPPSFSRFCRKEIPDDPFSELFRAAQLRWVNRMKDYRDCFVHYTPADTHLSIRLVRRAKGLETRCKLPINPNERDITRFQFPMSVELLRYAISLRRNMRAFDKAVASLLTRAHEKNCYPVRTQGLLTVGRRERGQG
jgi:hypothetical protein